ncbi:tetratricopeptide repeat-containing serine/threonine-protein kinase [Myxococcus sp. K15C18031901]|uniref:tetratricopeptide repeat-containing protein kinase family protein n=1 Tax=Myxococcus dinghuensis TaxID=2906761 RepID=UPI0020A74D18|nr:tetratricopeptide repeat-containing protein kinase family protein [Myxococcus dinghuensis]MCP3103284.1 tetratricopeptide repeat-containing serine/threonine-protein kinase [Myxococcus dinghuensis]
MELLREQTLSLATPPPSPGPLFDARPHATLSLSRGLSSALGLLHANGSVHRDPMPENLFLRPDGAPVRMDFGISARFGGSRGRETLDVSGAVVGSDTSMAPEQPRGTYVDARGSLRAGVHALRAAHGTTALRPRTRGVTAAPAPASVARAAGAGRAAVVVAAGAARGHLPEGRAAARGRASYTNGDIRDDASTLGEAEAFSLNADASPSNARPLAFGTVWEGFGEALALSGRQAQARKAFMEALARIQQVARVRRANVLRKAGKSLQTRHQNEEALRVHAQTGGAEFGPAPGPRATAAGGPKQCGGRSEASARKGASPRTPGWPSSTR